MELDRAVVARALEGRLTTVYQPIIDLERSQVVGYEAFLRYRGDHAIAPPVFSPDALLAAAQRIGRTPEMEAAALFQALLVRDDLPGNCGLFLNVSATALTDDRVIAVLCGERSLEGVVLELHDHEVESLTEVRDLIDTFRDRGALVAITEPSLLPDALEQLMGLEPSYIKLDRRLVAGIANSRYKLAIVDSLRHFARNLDMGVIAQGIEHLADLQSLERIGISFGQGFLIARPAPSDQLPRSVPHLDEVNLTVTGETRVARLVEPVCELTEAELEVPISAHGDLKYEVIVTDLREPLALLRRVGNRLVNIPMTLVGERETVTEAAKLAMRRPADSHFDPMVCVDALGTCVGVVRVDRLIDVLLSEASGRRHRTPRVSRHPRHS
ncbi:MAG: EAL domain-containing protein [Actinomycetia bacterium]|nr:EAL domain-containing protein [Actinomycetes bacterium]